MSGAVRTRVLTPQAYGRWARKLFDVYRIYRRRLQTTARLVGLQLVPHADAYWKPWAQAFVRRENVNRRTTGRYAERYAPPQVTAVGNLHDLVAHVCSGRREPN